MSLMVTGNEKRVEESVIEMIPEVDFTSTWHPVHHKHVLAGLNEAVGSYGLDTMKREYSITKNGMDMFGVWFFENPEDKQKLWSLGIRNSMQKHFAVGFTAGMQVVVCGNLDFSGEFLDFRKHTSGLTVEQITMMCMQIIAAMLQRFKEKNAWFDQLQSVPIIDRSFKVLTFNSMAQGALTPGKFNQFVDEYKTECDLYGQKTLKEFHGAHTRCYRGENLFNVQKKSAVLNRLMDGYLEN